MQFEDLYHSLRARRLGQHMCEASVGRTAVAVSPPTVGGHRDSGVAALHRVLCVARPRTHSAVSGLSWRRSGIPGVTLRRDWSGATPLSVEDTPARPSRIYVERCSTSGPAKSATPVCVRVQRYARAAACEDPAHETKARVAAGRQCNGGAWLQQLRGAAAAVAFRCSSTKALLQRHSEQRQSAEAQQQSAAAAVRCSSISLAAERCGSRALQQQRAAAAVRCSSRALQQ